MRAFLLLFILVSPVFAADKTAYVTAGCANNGDGTSASCAGAPAGAGAWNSCANMITGEVAANADLTAGGLNGNLIVNFANTASTVDTTRCVVAGFTTDTTHLLDFRGNWPGGIYSTSYYVLSGTAGSDDQGMLDIQDNDIRIDGFQVYDTSAGSGRRRAINGGSGAIRLRLTDSLIRNENCNIGGGGECWGLHWNPSVANCEAIVVNTVSYADGAYTAGFNVDCGGGSQNGAKVVLLNNTSFNGNTGYQCNAGGTSDTIDMENNIGNNNATAAYNAGCASGTYTTATRNTNLSEDTSSPNNTWDSLTVSFVSETGGSEDFRLQSGDTSAKNRGTDLSGNSNYAFSADAEGTARPQGAAWDIGFDEVASAGSGQAVLKILGF